MNGYQKMKTIRGLKATKIIASATALSMAVTGLAVGASANDATADEIARALGELNNFGIVADTYSAYSHFESNFAVHNLVLYTNFDSGYYVDSKSRTIEFSVSTEEIPEDSVTYYYGVYSSGTRIPVEYYSSNDGAEHVEDIISVNFTAPGTCNFVVTVPDEYKYDNLVIHELELDVEDDYAAYVIADDGYLLAADASDAASLKHKHCFYIA